MRQADRKEAQNVAEMLAQAEIKGIHNFASAQIMWIKNAKRYSENGRIKTLNIEPWRMG